MAGGNLGTLSVYLTAQTSQFNNALRNAQMSIGRFSAMAKVGMIAGAAAVSAFAVKSVQKYSVQEDAVNNFEAALRAGGDEVERTSKRIQKFASEMQSQTVFGDEQMLDTLAYARNLGITSDKLEEAGKAAAGLAAKYKLDLSSAMQLIGRASQGQTGTLTRYGIVLDETLTKEEKFNQLLKIGTSNFSLAQAQTNTLQGRIKQLSNAWGDLQESVGGFLLQLVNVKSGAFDATTAIQDLTNLINTNAHKWSLAIQEFAINVKYGFIAIYEVGKAFFENQFIQIFKWIDDFQVAFGWISKNWKTLLVNIDTVAVEAFKALGKNLLQALLLPMNIIVGKVTNLISGIKELDVEKLKNALTSQDVFSDFANQISGNIKTAMVNVSKDLKIQPPDFKDWKSQLNNMGDVILGVDDRRLEALKKLYEQPLAAAKEHAKQVEESVGAINNVKPVEMKFAGAVEKGTVDAYRAELAGKNTTEEYTKKTADNTGKMYKEAQKQTKSLRAFETLGVA